MVMPAYPHGYYVIGARIPWLSRLRLLQEEQWSVRMPLVQSSTASKLVAEALQISEGAPVIERHSELYGVDSGSVWGLGAVRYPAGGLSEDAAALLRDPEEITYEHLEQAFGRRITSYNERMLARMPSAIESERLGSSEFPVLDVRRVTLTSGPPISLFRFIGRSDCFEADYLIQV